MGYTACTEPQCLYKGCTLLTLPVMSVVVPQMRPRPLPFTYPSIQYSSITQPFDAVYSELVTASLHKQYVRQTHSILWNTRNVSGASGRVRNVAELKVVLTKLGDRRPRDRDWIADRRKKILWSRSVQTRSGAHPAYRTYICIDNCKSNTTFY